MNTAKPLILRRETYLKMIENSPGTKIFNSIFALVGDDKKDILENGGLSCATFVSNILFINGLLPQQRTTVNSLEKDLLASESYEQISPLDYIPEAGDIVIWEKIKFKNDTEHRHVGYILNEQEAISTSGIEKGVCRHNIYRNMEESEKNRRIEKIFRYRF